MPEKSEKDKESSEKGGIPSALDTAREFVLKYPDTFKDVDFWTIQLANLIAYSQTEVISQLLVRLKRRTLDERASG